MCIKNKLQVYALDNVEYRHFRQSRVSNSKVHSLIKPNFELHRNFMPILIMCKFRKDAKYMYAKEKVNKGTFGTRGHVTPDFSIILDFCLS